jgi:hypothetical protein
LTTIVWSAFPESCTPAAEPLEPRVRRSTNLRTCQAKALYSSLRPALGFLYRLQARMEKRDFPPSDKLFRLTATAYEALHPLSIALHYMSCKSGVGRKSQT